MSKLRGVFCPLVTPWDHRGELYPAKVRYNVSRLNRTGLAGLVAGSRPGEGRLLEPEEARRLFDLVREAADDDKRLVAGVSAESVRQSASLASAASDLGYEAVLAAPPSESWGDDGAARAELYYRSLGDRSPLPVYLDLDPCGAFPPEAVVDLASHPGIAGVVTDGEGDLTRRLLAEAPDGFDIVARGVHQLVELWEGGARAVVAPLANAVPFHLLSIEEALRTRESAAAAALLERTREALRVIYPALGPAGLKHAADLRGAYGGSPRLPGAPLSEADKERVAQSLDGLLS